MSDEAELKSEMRLWALEILAANAFAMICALDPNPDELANSIHQRMIAAARHTAFPEVADPALSDAIAAELESALDRLMGMVKTQMRYGLGKGGQ